MASAGDVIRMNDARHIRFGWFFTCYLEVQVREPAAVFSFRSKFSHDIARANPISRLMPQERGAREMAIKRPDRFPR